MALQGHASGLVSSRCPTTGVHVLTVLCSWANRLCYGDLGRSLLSLHLFLQLTNLL
jgi:hypothetical protein